MTPAEKSRGSAGRRQIITVSVMALLISGALGVRWALDREAGVVLSESPEDTRGYWTTGEARYGDRAIEVSANDVVLHRGAAGSLSGRLTVARELLVGGERVVRLEYVTAEGPDALEIVPLPGGTMHLRNQPNVVWAAGDAVAGLPLPAAVVDPPVRSPRGGLPSALLWGGLLLAAALLSVVLLSSRRGGASVAAGPAPDLVRGVWTTMDQRFEGRTIRIASGYAFSHFGPGDVRVGGVIKGAKEWREDKDRFVRLDYEGRDGSDHLEMVIDRSGHMRLAGGPKSVWVRR